MLFVLQWQPMRSLLAHPFPSHQSLLSILSRGVNIMYRSLYWELQLWTDSFRGKLCSTFALFRRCFSLKVSLGSGSSIGRDKPPLPRQRSRAALGPGRAFYANNNTKLAVKRQTASLNRPESRTMRRLESRFFGRLELSGLQLPKSEFVRWDLYDYVEASSGRVWTKIACQSKLYSTPEGNSMDLLFAGSAEFIL